jgi:hypothetical protein
MIPHLWDDTKNFFDRINRSYRITEKEQEAGSENHVNPVDPV